MLPRSPSRYFKSCSTCCPSQIAFGEHPASGQRWADQRIWPLRSLPTGTPHQHTSSSGPVLAPSVFSILRQTVPVKQFFLFVWLFFFPLIWPPVAGWHQHRGDQSCDSVWTAQAETPPYGVAGDWLPDTSAHPGAVGPATLPAEGKHTPGSHVVDFIQAESFCVCFFF